MANQPSRGSIIGVIAGILIGAAVIAYIVNLLLDIIVSTSTSTATNNTIATIRPIVSGAIVMVAVLAIIIVAGQMIRALGGI